MKKNKEKGFTLIELIAVLVIMAIIALIVTPLVMSIIRKARISADKRSIDAYGRSIELAIAGYLLDTGKFPTDVSQLTIEYSGNEVVCSTTQLNSDSSVYLAGCTVNGRSVDYTYGEDKNSVTYDAYEVGDEVTYNGVDYYVIKNSGTEDANATLLAQTPLTSEDVNSYGGYETENTHINKYGNNPPKAYGGYGSLQYYSNVDCGYGDNSNHTFNGCINSYAQSEIKYIVDAWANDNTIASDLVTDQTGYKVRLITIEELTGDLGYVIEEDFRGDKVAELNENVPAWVYNIIPDNATIATMNAYESSTNYIWGLYSSGKLQQYSAGNIFLVRPVITIKKSAL